MPGQIKGSAAERVDRQTQSSFHSPVVDGDPLFICSSYSIPPQRKSGAEAPKIGPKDWLLLGAARQIFEPGDVFRQFISVGSAGLWSRIRHHAGRRAVWQDSSLDLFRSSSISPRASIASLVSWNRSCVIWVPSWCTGRRVDPPCPAWIEERRGGFQVLENAVGLPAAETRVDFSPFNRSRSTQSIP